MIYSVNQLIKHEMRQVLFLVYTVLYYTVSQKNDTDVAHYNFNAHRPISLIFGTDIAQ